MGRSHRITARVALVLALLATACGGGGDGGADPLALPPAGERVDGELRVAAGEDIWPLTGTGPTAKHFAAGELNVGVYEPLLSLAPDFTVRPGLAERWEQRDDGSWRFHLRSGVSFHDGRPFTADDVVWSWTERALYPSSVAAGLAEGSVVAVDELTVDFRPAEVDNRLPEKLVHPEGAILPRGAHSDDQPPVGTGPYRVVEYVPRQRVTVEVFEGYWGDPPAAPRITFLFLPPAESRVQALLDGEVDVAASLDGSGAARVAAATAEGLRLAEAPPGAVQSLTFHVGGDTGSALAADLAVRRAVSLALDRAAYVAGARAGYGEPGRWLTPPAVLGVAAGAVAAPVFDPARAEGVLEDAGWVRGGDGVRHKGPQRLTLTLIGGPGVPAAGLDLVRDQLGRVGIEVATKHARDVVTLNEYRARGYDLELGTANQNDANPAFLVGLRAGGELGAGRADLAGAVEAARLAGSREEAQQAAAAAVHILVNEDALVLPLATVARVHGLGAGIRMGEVHPSAVNQRWATLAAGP